MQRHFEEPSTALETPTRVRYGVLGFMSALAFVLYIDRVCIGVASEAIRTDLGLTYSQMSYVAAAFTVAYALFEVPTGRWGDRYGSRGVLSRIVICWSAMTALTGAAVGFYSLVAVRFLFGAGEAGAYPNVAKVLARWMPVSERASAQGIIVTAAQIGSTTTPVLVLKCNQAIGWRWTFVLFGLLGCVWAFAFRSWFCDDPYEDPRVNDAERRRIAEGKAIVRDVHEAVPWRSVLRSANVWLMTGAQSAAAFSSYMYMTWYPTYLEKGRLLEKDSVGWLASLVLGGGAIGCLAGGFINDWLLRRTGSPRWTFSLWGWLGLSLGGVFLAASVNVDSPLGASLCAALACMFALSTQATFWSSCTLVSGQHLGVIFALINSVSVVGAVGSQLFLGHFAQWRAEFGYQGRDQWDPAFYIYLVVLLLGGICWLFVNTTRSAVPGDPSSNA